MKYFIWDKITFGIAWKHSLGLFAYIVFNRGEYLSMKITFWDTASCSLLQADRRFRETYCLQIRMVNKHRVKCMVLRAASMKLIAYWDIAPCSLVEMDWRFRSAHCLQNQDNEQAASEISDSHGGENEEDSLLEYRAGQSADYRPSEGGSTHYWNVDLRLFYSYVIYFITIFVSN